MRVLMFGKTGQLGHAVQNVASQMQGIRIIALSRDDVDLIDPEACRAAIERYAGAVDVVINAAAHTDVDRAEEEPDLARVINTVAPTTMAQVCAKNGIPFVHISTEYVFNGEGETPWLPSDPPDPINVYGHTKRGGEVGVIAAGGTFAIVRTSWVFSSHGQNFLKTMLRLSETKTSVQVVSDQIGGPTPASALAQCVLNIAAAFVSGTGTSGVFHFAGTPNTSWAEFAVEIFRQSGSGTIVTPIAKADYPTHAARPLNSRLDCALIQSAFGITRPDWRIALADDIARLSAEERDS